MCDSPREKHLDSLYSPTRKGEKIKNSLGLLEIGAPIFLTF